MRKCNPGMIDVRFSYNKLWKLLIDKGIKKKELAEMARISPTSIAKLGRGGNVNTEVLLRICYALDCNVEDIIEIVNSGNHMANTHADPMKSDEKAINI